LNPVWQGCAQRQLHTAAKTTGTAVSSLNTVY
jgi:hypothetical protein